MRNLTESRQTIDVQITDDATDTVLSEQYTLSPHDTDDAVDGEAEIVAVGETYTVDVVTEDTQETYEWEVTDGTGILEVQIGSTQIEFFTVSFEG